MAGRTKRAQRGERKGEKFYHEGHEELEGVRRGRGEKDES